MYKKYDRRRALFLITLGLSLTFGRMVPAQQIFDLPVGINPRASVAADFNHDGYSDLAIAEFGSDPNNGAVWVMLWNDAAKTFLTPVRYPTPNGKSPIALAVGDFNNDNNPDLAVVNYDSANVSILLGNSNGTFQPPRYVSDGIKDHP